MDSKVFSVYNLARGVFLSAKVMAADGVNEPLKILKVLVSGLGLDTESGLWIRPLSAIPAVPRLFPFDLLYLDRDQRVVEAVEIVPGADFPPYRREVASALVLARRTLESTQTGRGDRLIICVDKEVDRQIAAADASDLEPLTASARSSAAQFKGPIERNGKEKGTAASAISTEPFSSVVASPAEGAVPVAEAAGTCAVAMEPPQGVFGGITEKRVQSANSKSAEEASSSAAKDAMTGETPVISITEANIERPEGRNQSVVTGQQGGLEDLFSNWVDAPSSSKAWMPRNPRPGGAPSIPPAPGLVVSAPPEKNGPGVEEIEPDSKASKALQSRPISEPNGAAADVAGVPRKTAAPIEKPQETAAGPGNTTTPVQAPIPTRTANPQSPQTTTFTVANYGVWRVSVPTAISPLGAVQQSVQKSPVASEADKESSSVKETTSQEKPAGVTKAADSLAEALAPSGASRFAGPAGLPKERARTQAEVKVREPLETGDSKPVEDKAVLSPGAATQGTVAGIVASGHSERSRLVATEISSMAAKASLADIPDKPSIVSADNSRGHVSGKAAETAERPRSLQTTATAEDAAQKSQLEIPTVKAGVSAQSAASVPKPVKVVSKTVAPAKSAAPKAQPKTSIGRTEPVGKPKTGSLSLGTRFKRWLNPVAPTASDRRRAHRRYVPGMIAHYYSGGAPKPHDVADISMTGFYLLTEDRWMVETMIQMTLQKPCAKGERKQSITVLSKIVRRGSDGVAAQFVMPEDLDPQSHDILPSQATDKFSLARFL